MHIENVLYAFLISYLLFNIILPKSIIYLLILCIIWLYLLLRFLRKNIIVFIDKLIEINFLENTVKAKTMQIKSSMESRRNNQEKLDRLKVVYENKIEDFERELI